MTHATAGQPFQARLSRHGLDQLAQRAAARGLTLRAPRFLFLRHGETAGNHARIFQHPEIALNETGVEQAQRAAETLAGCGARRIVASTVRRAWQTAEIVAARLGMDAIGEDGLRERFFGDMIGTSSAELDWAADPPNGETLDGFITRAQQGLARALDTSEPSLLVAHGGTLYVLAYSIGLTVEDWMIRNATPLLFTRGEQGWSVQRIGAEDGALRGDNIGW